MICTEIDYGQPPKPIEIPTIAKTIEYCQDPSVKELFRTVLEELQVQKIKTKPNKGQWISCWYKEKRFMYMGSGKSFFVADILTPAGSWTGNKRISNRPEWVSLHREYIQSYIDHLDGKAA